MRLSSKTEVEGLWLRVIVADSLEPKGDILIVDNDWQLTVSGDVGQQFVRKAGNRTEVLVPVTWKKVPGGGYRAEITELFER